MPKGRWVKKGQNYSLKPFYKSTNPTHEGRALRSTLLLMLYHLIQLQQKLFHGEFRGYISIQITAVLFSDLQYSKFFSFISYCYCTPTQRVKTAHIYLVVVSSDVWNWSYWLKSRCQWGYVSLFPAPPLKLAQPLKSFSCYISLILTSSFKESLNSPTHNPEQSLYS